MGFLGATTSLPAVYRPNDDRWNATRSCQFPNPVVVDIATSSRIGVLFGLASWQVWAGLQSN